MGLKFKNPPINELVIGLYFNPPLATMRSEHVGFFWSKIHKSFPKSYNNPTIGGPDIMGPGEIFPMPRFWFSSNDESMLVQIQKNVFMVNWRKRENDYPHFDNVKKEFDSLYSEFENFLKSFVGIEDIYIDNCELTYVNIIPESDFYNGINDIKKIIPTFRFPECGISSIGGINSRTTYEPTDSIKLVISIQNRVTIKEKLGVLNLEIRTFGKPSNPNKGEADRWFSNAHKIIGECFLQMTSKEAQQFWIYEED